MLMLLLIEVLLNELYVWGDLDQKTLFFKQLICFLACCGWHREGTGQSSIRLNSTKLNLTQQTGREITFLVGCDPWCNLQLRYISEGSSESEQLGTRMVGLTILETGQIYVRLKRQHSCSLRRAHVGKQVRRAHSVQQLIEKQLHKQKTSIFLRISYTWLPGCGIYYIFAFS